MNVITLIHDRKLRYPKCSETLDEKKYNKIIQDDLTIISFAKGSGSKRIVTGTERCLYDLRTHLFITHFDTSPLFALIFWDLAHSLQVGKYVFITKSNVIVDLLKRDYYKNNFSEVDSIYNDIVCFRKISLLPAEKDRGLDSWSFCIPTGQGDPVLLNACVERILSLGVPKYEIILCGKPSKDFLYWSKVRIIEYDPHEENQLHITHKKNLLARESRYPNLCILHDRVLLPTNFMQAVLDYGDDYPLTGFQSLWSPDRWNIVSQRYSDAGVVEGLPEGDWPSDSRERLQDLRCCTSMRARHPDRSNFGSEYLTGSLCISKKSVWKIVPQNETLYWQEYEDLEQSFRAAHYGIPCRINPYSFTRSMRLRSALLPGMALRCDNVSGRISTYRPNLLMTFFPRRPALNISQKDCIDKINLFIAKYNNNFKKINIKNYPKTGLGRYVLFVRLIWSCSGDFSDLVADIHKYLLCEPPTPGDENQLIDIIHGEGNASSRRLKLICHTAFIRQVWNNPLSSPHINKAEDDKAEKWISFAFGAILGALNLKFFSSHIKLKLSLREILTLLQHSEPGR